METLNTILNNKIIAIARGLYGDSLISASKALYDGGIRVFEVTFEQNKPFVQTNEAVEQLYNNLPNDVVVGVGTVLSAEQLISAARSNAAFAISPNTNCGIIAQTKALGMVSIPGALTPTEIITAYDSGADIVKVFPAGMMGVEYFKAIVAPLKYIPMAAVAGINLNNIKRFADAGAVAFGISSGLYNKEHIANCNYSRITQLAREYCTALNE